MDMNALLHAHQIAKFGHTRAATPTARADHADDMADLATRIRTLRAESGADVETAPFVAGEEIAEYCDR